MKRKIGSLARFNNVLVIICSDVFRGQTPEGYSFYAYCVKLANGGSFRNDEVGYNSEYATINEGFLVDA